LTSLGREIRLEGDLTNDHRTFQLAIADEGPAHRTRPRQAMIKTELA